MLGVLILYIFPVNQFVICSNGRGYPQEVVNMSQLTDIPTLDGSTELQQFTRFLQMLSNPSSQVEPSLEFVAHSTRKSVVRAAHSKYTVVPMYHQVLRERFLEYTQNKNGQRTKIVLFTFDITETTDGVQPSKGGTTFTITTKGMPTSDLSYSKDSTELYYTEGNCPYKDHFNGSYTVWCAIQDSVTEIVLHSMHTNFAAFNEKPAEKRRIMRRTLIYDGTLPVHPTNSKNCINGLEPTWDYPVMYWLYQHNISTWVKNGCALDFLSSEDIQQCFKNRFNNSLSVIGDSHLAYSFFYIISLIDAPTASALADKVTSDVNIGDYSLYWTTFLDTFTVNIKRLMVKFLQKKYKSLTPRRHLLVMDAGTKNNTLCYDNVKEFSGSFIYSQR